MVEIEIVLRETLSDGKSVLHFSGGGKFIYPPVPDEKSLWAEKTAAEICRIQYAARRERDAAGIDNDTPPC